MIPENIKSPTSNAHTALIRIVLFLLAAIIFMSAADAARNHYQSDKVVYDVSSSHTSELHNILHRANLLQRLYDNDPFESSIIIILHEGAIPLFAKSSKRYQYDLIQRAQGLAAGEVIQFRVCTASAKMQGFSQDDFEDFITMIPMADAEIIQLQQKGFAYLHG